MDIETYKVLFHTNNTAVPFSKIPNWLFVEAPYDFLKMLFECFYVFVSMFDFTSNVIAEQSSIFTKASTMLNAFGGKTMTDGSIMALVMCFSGVYLGYYFFFKNGQFGKKFLRLMLVFFTFYFWFGTITYNGTTTTGGQWLVTSAHNVAQEIKGKVESVSSTLDGGNSEMAGEGQTVQSSSYFQEVIAKTFWEINFGCGFDEVPTKYPEVDVERMIIPEGLSDEEKAKKIDERQKYINKLFPGLGDTWWSEDGNKKNPYWGQNLNYTIEKSLTITVAYVDLFTIGLPLMYINLMLSLMEVVILFVIIAMPLVLVLSFFPAMENILLKSFKALLGLSFYPVVLSLAFAFYLFLNHIFDNLIKAGLNALDTGTGILILGGLGGIVVQALVIAFVKVIFMILVWKNRYRITSFFTDGKVQGNVIEEKVVDKTKEIAKTAGNMAVGGTEVAAGAMLGNPQLVGAGVNRMSQEVKNSNAPDFVKNGAQQGLSGVENHFSEIQQTKELKEKNEKEQINYSVMSPQQVSSFISKQSKDTKIDEETFTDLVESGKVNTWTDLERLKGEQVHKEKMEVVRKIQREVTVEERMEQRKESAKAFLGLGEYKKNWDYGSMNRGMDDVG